MKHVGGGWVRLSASIVDSPIFSTHGDMFRLWIVLLCMAHRSQEPLRLVGGAEIGQGELATSLSGLAHKLERNGNPQDGEPARVVPSRQTVSRYLDTMEREGMISRRSTPNRGTIISIINFRAYQDPDTYRLARADRQADASGQGKARDNAPQAPAGEGASGQASVTRADKSGTRAAMSDSGRSDLPDHRSTHTDLARAPDQVEGQPEVLQWRIWREFQVQWSKAHNDAPAHLPTTLQTHLDEVVRQLRGLAANQGERPDDDQLLRKAAKLIGEYLKLPDEYLVSKHHPVHAFPGALPGLLEADLRRHARRHP